jgi:hypothetical protein
MSDIDRTVVDDNEEESIWKQKYDGPDPGDVPQRLNELIGKVASAVAVLEAANECILDWFIKTYTDMTSLTIRNSLFFEQGFEYFYDPTPLLSFIFEKWIAPQWINLYMASSKQKTGRDVQIATGKKRFREYRKQLFQAIVGFKIWYGQIVENGKSFNFKEDSHPTFSECISFGRNETRSSIEDFQNSLKANEKKRRNITHSDPSGTAEVKRLRSKLVTVMKASKNVLEQLKTEIPQEHVETVLKLMMPFINEQFDEVADSIEEVVSRAEEAATKAADAADAASEAKVAAEKASEKAQATAFRASSENIVTDGVENEAAEAAEAKAATTFLATLIAETTDIVAMEKAVENAAVAARRATEAANRAREGETSANEVYQAVVQALGLIAMEDDSASESVDTATSKATVAKVAAVDATVAAEDAAVKAAEIGGEVEQAAADKAKKAADRAQAAAAVAEEAAAAASLSKEAIARARIAVDERVTALDAAKEKVLTKVADVLKIAKAAEEESAKAAELVAVKVAQTQAVRAATEAKAKAAKATAAAEAARKAQEAAVKAAQTAEASASGVGEGM